MTFYDFLATIRPLVNASRLELAAGLPTNTLGKHYRHADGKPNGQPCHPKHFPAIARALCAVFGVIEINGHRANAGRPPKPACEKRVKTAITMRPDHYAATADNRSKIVEDALDRFFNRPDEGAKKFEKMKKITTVYAPQFSGPGLTNAGRESNASSTCIAERVRNAGGEILEHLNSGHLIVSWEEGLTPMGNDVEEALRKNIINYADAARAAVKVGIDPLRVLCNEIGLEASRASADYLGCDCEYTFTEPDGRWTEYLVDQSGNKTLRPPYVSWP